MNIGFREARGDFLTWTSDDNLYLPTAIERMVQVLQSGQADFVFATVQTLSKQENLDRFPRDYFDACIYDDYEIIGLSQEAA